MGNCESALTTSACSQILQLPSKLTRILWAWAWDACFDMSFPSSTDFNLGHCSLVDNSLAALSTFTFAYFTDSVDDDLLNDVDLLIMEWPRLSPRLQNWCAPLVARLQRLLPEDFVLETPYCRLQSTKQRQSHRGDASLFPRSK